MHGISQPTSTLSRQEMEVGSKLMEQKARGVDFNNRAKGDDENDQDEYHEDEEEVKSTPHVRPGRGHRRGIKRKGQEDGDWNEQSKCTNCGRIHVLMFKVIQCIDMGLFSTFQEMNGLLHVQ